MAQTYLPVCRLMPAHPGHLNGSGNIVRASSAGIHRSATQRPVQSAPGNVIMQLDPQQPPQIDPDALKNSALRLAQIAGLGGFFGLLWHLADAFKQRNWTQRMIVLLSAACIGAVAGPTLIILASWIASYYGGIVLPTDVKLAIGCVAAGMGSSLLDMAIATLKRWQRVRLDDPEDIDSYRQNMSPEQRARHADTCVFSPDRCGGACLKCPHRSQFQNNQDRYQHD